MNKTFSLTIEFFWLTASQKESLQVIMSGHFSWHSERIFGKDSMLALKYEEKYEIVSFIVIFRRWWQSSVICDYKLKFPDDKFWEVIMGGFITGFHKQAQHEEKIHEKLLSNFTAVVFWVFLWFINMNYFWNRFPVCIVIFLFFFWFFVNEIIHYQLKQRNFK